jgi:hypothetical protein
MTIGWSINFCNVTISVEHCEDQVMAYQKLFGMELLPMYSISTFHSIHNIFHVEHIKTGLLGLLLQLPVLHV